MTKLKQACVHPALLLGDGSPLPGRSGKLERLEEIVDGALAAGESVLAFTQFARFGAMLTPHLAARFGVPVRFLHGGTPRRERDDLVAAFQSDERPGVFVLSLKAGGTGINLTAANHVVHVDRWWNPATEAQATDRAYRIGQSRDVRVHTLLCLGTLEERIDRLLVGQGCARRAGGRQRRGLAHRPVHDASCATCSAWPRRRSLTEDSLSLALLGTFESLRMGPTFARGRRDERAGHVRELTVSSSLAVALVRGPDDTRAVRARIAVRSFGASEWARVEQDLAAEARFAAELLAGRMPAGIGELVAAAGLEPGAAVAGRGGDGLHLRAVADAVRAPGRDALRPGPAVRGGSVRGIRLARAAVATSCCRTCGSCAAHRPSRNCPAGWPARGRGRSGRRRRPGRDGEPGRSRVVLGRRRRPIVPVGGRPGAAWRPDTLLDQLDPPPLSHEGRPIVDVLRPAYHALPEEGRSLFIHDRVTPSETSQ